MSSEKPKKHNDEMLCFRCEQTIYQLELLGPILGKIYHKSCFRCFYCDRYLDLKSFSVNKHDLSDKHVYCASHTPKSKDHYVICVAKSLKPIANSKNHNTLKCSIQNAEKNDDSTNTQIAVNITLSYLRSENKFIVFVHAAK